MKLSFRTVLLIASALLMIFGAAGYSFTVVPDLHGDLVEIGVRPTVLGGTVLYLYFSAIAMFGFALMVSAAAIQAIRGISPARFPLVVIAAIYTAFGVLAFLVSAIVFAIHVGYEYFLGDSPRSTALNAAGAVAVGAFALAVTANIHGRLVGSNHQRLLVFALVAWPALTAVPAFVVALVAAAGLDLWRGST